MTLPRRFLAKIEFEEFTGCWLWVAAKNQYGYGNFNNVAAHRFAYEALVGEIPKGLVIDHLCDKPACVNPTHMRVVTQAENVMRGSSPPARNARKKRCVHGHLLDGKTRNGHRYCLTCNRLRAAANRQKARTEVPKASYVTISPLSSL